MYGTPVIYSISSLPAKYKMYVLVNPLSSIVEAFRYAYLGSGNISWTALCYSAGFMFILLLLGVIIFNRVERSFMDTV